VLVAGPPITPTRGHCWFLGGEADGLDALLRAVAERASRGVDVVKIMATGGMLTPGRALHESQYPRHELAAVTDATHRAGLPLTAHAHGPRGIADAVAVGVDGVEHCSFVGSTGIEPDWSTCSPSPVTRPSGRRRCWTCAPCFEPGSASSDVRWQLIPIRVDGRVLGRICTLSINA
jgi:hypothetical protein